MIYATDKVLALGQKPLDGDIVAQMGFRVSSGLSCGVTASQTEELARRRDEIKEGMQQVEFLVSVTEHSMKEVSEVNSANNNMIALARNRLECALGLSQGLRKGIEALAELDDCPEYPSILRDIVATEHRVMQLSSILEYSRATDEDGGALSTVLRYVSYVDDSVTSLGFFAGSLLVDALSLPMV